MVQNETIPVLQPKKNSSQRFEFAPLCIALNQELPHRSQSNPPLRLAKGKDQHIPLADLENKAWIFFFKSFCVCNV